MPNLIDNRGFMVGKNPYCVWYPEGTDASFLDGIETNYFQYLSETHAKNLDGEYKQKAAIALRTAYYHGLETLFMLIFAALQAPGSVVGWLLKCQPKQLREFVGSATLGELSLMSSTRWKVENMSWDKISALINGQLFAGRDDSETMQKSFATLWGKFATDFTEKIVVDEYNSFKHGFRVGVGAGPSLSVSPPPQSEGQPVTVSSDFGSTFFVAEKLADAKAGHLDHHFRLKYCHVNLQPNIMVEALFMISMSIKNVVAFLKVGNGFSPNEIQFTWPTSKEAFDLFSRALEGLASLDFNLNIPEKAASLTQQQIVQHMTKLAQRRESDEQTRQKSE